MINNYANNFVFQYQFAALDAKNLEELEGLITTAMESGMQEEKSVQYAVKTLETWRLERQQQEEDQKLYEIAVKAKQEEDEKNRLLEREFMELEQKVLINLIITNCIS